MTTTTYHCPLCGKTMERNLAIFLSHTDQHVIDQIKKEHPEWVEANGACQPCAEYYRKQLNGESSQENIGPRGRRSRLWMGVVMLTLSFGLACIIKTNGPNSFRVLLLFPLLFSGMLGLFQAREKTCAFLAERGLRDMDGGIGKITDPGVAIQLKRRGRGVLIKAGLGALALTVLLFLI